MHNRPATVMAALTLAAAVLLGAAPSAAAHGDTIHLELSTRPDGHVQAVATFEDDKDPVTEGLAATLTAHSPDGRTAGPWPLLPVPGKTGTYTTTEALAPGQWTVTADAAFPSLGHSEAVLTVPAPRSASNSATEEPTSAVRPGNTSTPGRLVATTAVGGVAVALLTTLLCRPLKSATARRRDSRRRRPTTGRPEPERRLS
ncbi:hypothetical protein ABT095_35500 [Kitasatospora sp. NPDC002227]|uniref:hypothetical protein n=1 Tax=Kitasatospora sp. NPDC002227 TaxID=3154773 RepID=UPI0033187216